MTLTSYEWLESYPGGRAALSLVIEGQPVTFGTEQTGAAGWTSIYVDDIAPYGDFNDPIGGLDARGVISQAIKLYAPDIEPDTLQFTVTDYSETLIGTILREGNSSGNRTYLTTSIDAGSTSSIAVQSTTGFASSGIVYIGGEAIAYSGKTGTTFTGITRGQYTINQCDDGSAFAPAHIIGANVSNTVTTAPSVTDYPRTWHGRYVHLFLHIKDPLTGQFQAASAATKLWTGRITGYGDGGEGKIRITAKSVHEVLNKPLGLDAWRGRINEGRTLTTSIGTYRIANSKTAVYALDGSLTLSGRYTHDELAAVINTKFQSLTGSMHSGDLWSIELEDRGDGSQRYVVRLRANTTAITGGEFVALYLQKELWDLLGFTQSPTVQVTNGNPLRGFVLTPTSSAGTTLECVAASPPVVYYFKDIGLGTILYVTEELNTFETQAAEVINATAQTNGVVRIKGGKYDAVYAVQYTAGSPSTIKIQGQLRTEDGTFRFPGDQQSEDSAFVRLGDASEAPEVRQMWFDRGRAGRILLEALLSTGVAAYNHADYDVLPVSLGLGIPASLVDIESFENLNDVMLWFVADEPRPYYEYLERVLAVTGSYVVWKPVNETASPKLSVVQPSLDTVYNAAWNLNESNKGRADRTTVDHSAEGIINRMVVKFGTNIGDSEANSVVLTVDDLASQSDYGRKKTVTIVADTVLNVPSIIEQTLTPALAYFSRPLAVASRSINASLWRMAPGDTAILEDNYVVDPLTGARGCTIYCWVLSTSMDIGTGVGDVTVIFLPEKKASRTGKFAPSAHVDNTAPTGGYVSATKILTLRAHEYTESASSTTDVDSFAAGDKVHIYQLDSSSPLEWFDTIASKGVNSVTLTTGLAGWVSTNRYVMEFDDINTVVSTQLASDFIADASTLSTGYSTPTPYEFGKLAPQGVAAGTPIYTTGMARPNNTYDDQGEPYSVHKINNLAKAVNSLLSYRTRQVLINDYWPSAANMSGTTPTLFYTAWVPIFGHVGTDGARDLIVRVRLLRDVTGTGTVTVTSSIERPVGSSWTAFSFPHGATQVSATSVSASYAWSSEMTLKPSAKKASSGTYGTWISVYLTGSAAGTVVYCNQLFVAEAAL